MADTGIFRELHAVIVPVPDLDAARAFYGGVLGLEVARHMDGMMTVFRTGGPTHVCCFLPFEEAEGPAMGGSFPNFRSDDIAATRAHLVEHGVECSEIQAAPELKFLQASDPFGNRFDVCEYGEDWLP